MPGERFRKPIETVIRDFSGGMVNDPRTTRDNVGRVITNFDVITNPRKITPWRQSESGDANASDSQKKIFDLGYWTITGTWRLFGLGVVTGTTRASVHMKKLTTGDTEDLDDSAWLDPANNTSSNTGVNQNFFKYYHKTGKFYGARTNALWSFTPDGSTAFNETELSVTYTNIAQGIVHSNDDILYVPIDNKIYKNDNGVWSLLITLPNSLYITSICEFGRNIAIAMSPLSGLGSSRVFVWDRVVSTVGFSDTMDAGEGELKVLEEVGGYLIGISISGNNTTRFSNRMIFRYLTGNALFGYRFEQLEQFLLSSSGTLLLTIAKQKINNRLYFLARMYINGAQRDGVFSIGKPNGKEYFSIVHERTPNNDTALSSGTSNLHGFFFVGDYCFIAYTHSSAVALSKTDDSEAYPTAIFETKKYDGSEHGYDSSYKKDLLGVTIMTEPLDDSPASQVVVKYKIDAETSYTTILTHSTDAAVSKSAINIESSGAALPKDYKEIEFRLESTAGAEITGFSFKEDVTGKRAYDRD